MTQPSIPRRLPSSSIFAALGGALVVACGGPPERPASIEDGQASWQRVADGVWARYDGDAKELWVEGRAGYDHLIRQEEEALAQAMRNTPALTRFIAAKTAHVARLYELRAAAIDTPSASQPMTLSTGCTSQFGIGGSGNVVYAGISVSCATAQSLYTYAEACCSDYGGAPTNCGYPDRESGTKSFESSLSDCGAMGNPPLYGNGTVYASWPNGSFYRSQAVTVY